MTLTDEELFEGLNREQMEGYQAEAAALWGDTARESNRRIRSLSKAQWRAVKKEGDDLTRALAALMDRQPEDAQVQDQVARHHAWLQNFWEPTPESYRALGQGYADDPRFRATYDEYRPGLADFLAQATAYYAEHRMSRRNS